MRTFTLVALTATLIFSGNTFGQEALIGDCGCQGSNIAPVVYQEPMVENSLEGAVIEAGVGSVEPVADSASVVDSPIIDSATTYEGAPMAQGEMIIEGTPMAEGEDDRRRRFNGSRRDDRRRRFNGGDSILRLPVCCRSSDL